MNNLYFLIKIPRSGGTTFAKDWLNGQITSLVPQEGNFHNYPVKNNYWGFNCYPITDGIYNLPRWTTQKTVLHVDDIRSALYGTRFNSHCEEYVKTIKDTMIKTLLKEYEVLVDDTHTTWASIERVLAINPDATPVFFPSRNTILTSQSINFCLNNAEKTNQKDLLPIIHRMIDNLTLTLDNFDEKLKAAREKARKIEHRII